MSKPAVSILVPVYKVEKYLARCLDSVLAQDFADWEMVLVDDGSPDRCPQICDEYAARDARIRVVHKENGGVMVARLVALQNSKADYVMFVDSDDWLMPSAVGVLYRKIQEGFDIVRGTNVIADDRGMVGTCVKSRQENVVMSGALYALLLARGEIDPFLWGGIYRKQVFSEAVFQRVIDFGIVVGEDYVTNMLSSSQVSSACLIPVVVYAYYQNEASMMHQQVMGRAYAGRVDSCLSDYVDAASEEMKALFRLNQICGIVSRDFQPEIVFSKSDYAMVRHYLSDDGQRWMFNQKIPKKYRWCINCLPLYWLYTNVCRRLIGWKKYKGKRRKVI